MKWLLKQGILWHRYLGICFCLFFAIWFISGIVLMYAGFPIQSESDRLAHAATLDLSSAKFTPDQAIDKAGLLDSPSRVSIVMMSGIPGPRPAYRFYGEVMGLVTVSADDARPLRRLEPAEVIRIASSYDGVPESKLRFVRRLTAADQWTVYPGSRPYFPLDLVAADDGKETEYYVSHRSGSVYLRTDRRSRFLAWIGAIPHWWYIRALRAHSVAWSRTMIAASSLGVLMCLAGIVAGVLRFSPTKRYRFPGERHSYLPYAGWKRWHYLFTMFFGLATFTWIFSGLLTMDPGDWSPGADPEQEEMQAFAGGELDTSAFTVAPAQAAAAFRSCIEPAAMEMIVFGGKPYYLARDRNAQARLLPGDRPGAECISALSAADLLAAAQRAVPGARPLDDALLTSYDAYYYDRDRRKPLPVLRVRFADARKTWLYVDPGTARIAARYTNRSRAERWLYQGLHDLDFPFLYWHRPAWDVTVIVLCLGGIALSVTGIIIAFDYSRRSAKRNVMKLRR